MLNTLLRKFANYDNAQVSHRYDKRSFCQLVYYDFSFINTDASPTVFRTIFPVANRPHHSRPHCDWLALRAGARSTQNSREVVDLDGDGVHRHGGCVDDFSAPAVLCEEVWRG